MASDTEPSPYARLGEPADDEQPQAPALAGIHAPFQQQQDMASSQGSDASGSPPVEIGYWGSAAPQANSRPVAAASHAAGDSKAIPVQSDMSSHGSGSPGSVPPPPRRGSRQTSPVSGSEPRQPRRSNASTRPHIDVGSPFTTNQRRLQVEDDDEEEEVEEEDHDGEAADEADSQQGIVDDDEQGSSEGGSSDGSSRQSGSNEEGDADEETAADELEGDGDHSIATEERERRGLDRQRNCLRRELSDGALSFLETQRESLLLDYTPIIARQPIDSRNPIRAVAMHRRIRLFITITIYNESADELRNTLKALCESMEPLQRVCGISWKEVFVLCVQDGREKMSTSMEKWLIKHYLWDRRMLLAEHQNAPVTCHLFERTIRLARSRTNREYFAPLQIGFAAKEKNGGKLNSHLWAFSAFARQVQPEFLQLLDVGTMPRPYAIARLVEAMQLNPQVAGVCGEIAVWKPNFMSFVQAAQVFEYVIQHVLLKTFESICGFIGVLPGAFSAYRWKAMRGEPLNQYFLLEEVPFREIEPAMANMYLAEDRVLCYELVAKRRRNYTLHFVNDAVAETDIPKTLTDLIKQRRRWLNGTFFALIYVLLGFPKLLRRSDHTITRRIVLTLQFIINFGTMLIAWFGIGSLFLSFFLIYTLSFQQVGPEAGSAIMWAFSSSFMIIILALILLAVGNKPDEVARVYSSTSVGLGVIMYFSIVLSAWHLSTGDLDLIVLFAASAAFGLYGISTAVYWRFDVAVLSIMQYLFMLPTFVTTFALYSFANLNDISWGTREGGLRQQGLERVKVNAGAANRRVFRDDQDLTVSSGSSFSTTSSEEEDEFAEEEAARVALAQAFMPQPAMPGYGYNPQAFAWQQQQQMQMQQQYYFAPGQAPTGLAWAGAPVAVDAMQPGVGPMPNQPADGQTEPGPATAAAPAAAALPGRPTSVTGVGVGVDNVMPVVASPQQTLRRRGEGPTALGSGVQLVDDEYEDSDDENNAANPITAMATDGFSSRRRASNVLDDVEVDEVVEEEDDEEKNAVGFRKRQKRGSKRSSSSSSPDLQPGVALSVVLSADGASDDSEAEEEEAAAEEAIAIAAARARAAQELADMNRQKAMFEKEKEELRMKFIGFRTRTMLLWMASNWIYVTGVLNWDQIEYFAFFLAFVMFFTLTYQAFGCTWYLVEKYGKRCWARFCAPWCCLKMCWERHRVARFDEEERVIRRRGVLEVFGDGDADSSWISDDSLARREEERWGGWGFEGDYVADEREDQDVAPEARDAVFSADAPGQTGATGASAAQQDESGLLEELRRGEDATSSAMQRIDALGRSGAGGADGQDSGGGEMEDLGSLLREGEEATSSALGRIDAIDKSRQGGQAAAGSGAPGSNDDDDDDGLKETSLQTQIREAEQATADTLKDLDKLDGGHLHDDDVEDGEAAAAAAKKQLDDLNDADPHATDPATDAASEVPQQDNDDDDEDDDDDDDDMEDLAAMIADATGATNSAMAQVNALGMVSGSRTGGSHVSSSSSAVTTTMTTTTTTTRVGLTRITAGGRRGSQEAWPDVTTGGETPAAIQAEFVSEQSPPQQSENEASAADDEQAIDVPGAAQEHAMHSAVSQASGLVLGADDSDDGDDSDDDDMEMEDLAAMIAEANSVTTAAMGQVNELRGARQ